MKDVYVVTHTQSLHHVEGKVGGWYDTGLTTRGKRDALLIAERLADLKGPSDVEIFSSDLLRASGTARIIGERLGRPVHEMRALREIGYGVAEGKPQAWLDERYTPAPDHNRLDHDCGIEGAETRRQVAERVFPAMAAIIARDCATQIIVSHGFTLTMIVAAWLKLPIEASGFLAFPAKPGSITHLRQDDFWRNRAVMRLADFSHLEPDDSLPAR